MRIFAALAFLLASLPAFAQTLTGTLTFNSAAAYQGVGDFDTNIVHYWGTSAVSNAVATGGTKSGVDLSNNSTTCTGVKFLSTGQLDLTSGLYCNGATQTVTTWCASTCVYNGTAHVVTLYDQVGSANETAAYASAPVFVLSGFSSHPTVQCGGGTSRALTATITAFSNPQTAGVTFEQFANFTTNETFSEGVTSVVIDNAGAANSVGGIAAGGIAELSTATATNGTGTSDFTHGHAVVFTVNSAGTSQALFLDGAQISGSPATIAYGGTTGTTWALCAGSGGTSNYADIYLGKAWIDNVAITTTIADEVTNQTTVPLP